MIYRVDGVVLIKEIALFYILVISCANYSLTEVTNF